MKKKLLIPIFLGALAVPLCIQKQAEGLNAQMFGEVGGSSSDKSAYVKYASEIGAQIADEGFVLLKNDGFLPMQTQGKKVSIASKGSANFVRGGTGSGSGNVDGSVSAYDIESSLTAVGFEINPTLKSFYSNSSKSGSGRSDANPNRWDGVNYSTIGETPLKSYSSTELNSMDTYNDAIFLVITRQGSEGCDLKAGDARDSTSDPFTQRHALQLSKNEEDLFNEIKKHTDHVIVIVNSSNVFECGVFEDDDKVSAVLWIGNPGDVGPGAIGRILSGQVNPSGRTVDTWARDFKEDPTFQNFGDNSQTNLTEDANGNEMLAPQDTMFNADGTPTMCWGADKTYTDHDKPNWADELNLVVKGGLNGVRPAQYVSYEEGIYYDYRYYETKYDDMKANDEGAADEWYNGSKGVVYPFGYGLSYTTFKQEIISSNLPEGAIDDPNLRVEMKVKVTNTGTVAGKEVAQLYFRAPYKKGGIEKASKVLCAFDKTDVLQPNESQELTLKFHLQDVASYDFTDANKNRFKGYELDGGDYQLVLGKNAHEEIDTVDFKVQKKGLQYAVDRYTGYPVVNRFTDNGFFNSLPGEDDIEFTQMSRKDFAKTFPTHPDVDDRTLGQNSRVEEFYTHEFTLKDIDIDKTYEYMPKEAYKTKEDIEDLDWKQAENTSGTVTVKLTDLLNTDMDDPRWKEFMDQLTYSEMIGFVHGTSTHNPAISRVSKQSTGDSDGPQRFKIMWWVSGPIVAATYNVELARKQGECIGMEGKINGTQGWAGPGVNIHRSPFGGRNFEYYSADPFLTGRISGRVVSGATDRGVYCYFKHFAVNDQEKGREGVSAFVNEQALREIYLKAFQLPIQEGKAIGIMSSYNRLGLMETAASYPLLTEVLRNEWGFKGSVISDMTHRGNGSVNNGCYENINNRLLAGCNQQLDSQNFEPDMNATWNSELKCPTFKYEGDTYESYSWWYAVRTMAQQCIWMNARSSKYVSSFITPINDIVISGTEDGVFYAKSGEQIDIEITLPDSLAVGQQYNSKNITAVEVSIDPFTALPAGLTYANNHITGVVEKTANKFIHVLVDLTLEGQTNKTTVGKSFELAVTTTMPEVKVKSGGGCGGSITMTASLIGLVAVAGAGVLLTKKRKQDQFINKLNQIIIMVVSLKGYHLFICRLLTLIIFNK